MERQIPTEHTLPRAIAGLSMVKNEADIIEDFVRHNLNYLDELHIILQDSCDGTSEILNLLEKEGLNIVVIPDDDKEFRQGKKLTFHGKRLLGRSDIGAVVLVDADEFIKAPSKSLLGNVLLSIPDDCFGLFHWESYVPTEPVGLEQPLLQSITHRVKDVSTAPTKAILTKLFLDDDYKLQMGFHSVKSISRPNLTMRHAHLRNMALAHFPIRSISQLEKKVRNGVSQLPSSNPSVGAHWRTINSLINQGDDSFFRMQQMAADYQFQTELITSTSMPELVCDPLTCNYTKKYQKYIKCSVP